MRSRTGFIMLISALLVIAGISGCSKSRPEGQPEQEGTSPEVEAGENAGAASDASADERVSRPGEYTGYSDAIYADEYDIRADKSEGETVWLEPSE